MTRRIVVDSSANVLEFSGIELKSVPLKITVGEQEFVDDASLDCAELLTAMSDFSGAASSSCPNVADWQNAFEGADEIIAIAISGNISGAYNAAYIASWQFEAEHPGSRVYVLDSFSTGPEMELLVEKVAQLLSSDMPFDQVVQKAKTLTQHTHLLFSLESLDNLAKNGRVNPVVAKAAGLLGVRVIGCASEEGRLEVIAKVRGEKKAIPRLVNEMLSAGYFGGSVRISHTGNLAAAEKLAEMLETSFPGCDIAIRENRGLCSFYTQQGGLLVGFETAE